MKIYLICLYCCFSFLCYSQEENVFFYKSITSYVDSLKRQKIDTIFLYEKGCSGCIDGYKKSASIFWKKNNMVNVCVLDNYYGRKFYQQISNIFTYYFKNENALKTEILDSTNYMSHYSYYNFEFYVGKNNFKKTIPEYYLHSNDNSTIVNYLFRLEYTLCNNLK